MTSLILDLAGYTPENGRLAERRLLEPSCGDGAFLATIIQRLIASERQHRPQVNWEDPALTHSLTACDLNSGFVALARQQVIELLQKEGCPAGRARALGEQWIRHTDFLLTSWHETFDFVVGNPPYVRIEDLPPKVLGRYREMYPTCTDRADLYAAAIEHTEQLIVPVITVYEVAKKLAREAGDEVAAAALSLMQRGQVVPVDLALALQAAVNSLPLADSLIYATARQHGAELWTQDSHFDGLAGVRYFAKIAR